MKVSLVLVLGLLMLASPVEALILTGTGNQPVHDPGWPVGAVEVANLPSRIGWWEGPPFGGGEWHFEYPGQDRRVSTGAGRLRQDQGARSGFVRP